MFEKDNSLSMVQGEVSAAKQSTTLQSENQKQDDSGHQGYGSGPSQSAAVPSGSPGKGAY